MARTTPYTVTSLPRFRSPPFPSMKLPMIQHLRNDYQASVFLASVGKVWPHIEWRCPESRLRILGKINQFARISGSSLLAPEVPELGGSIRQSHPGYKYWRSHDGVRTSSQMGTKSGKRAAPMSVRYFGFPSKFRPQISASPNHINNARRGVSGP